MLKKDWEIVVFQIVGQRELDTLSSDTIYYAMIAFLRNWSDLGTDGTISGLCENLEMSNPKNVEWIDAVRTVLGGNDGLHMNLVNPTK